MLHVMLATTPLPADLAAAGQHVRRASAAAEEAAVSVRDLLASPQMKQRLDEVSANLTAASASLARLAKQAEALAGDQQLQEDLRQSVAQIRATTASLQRTASHLEQVLTDQQATEDLRQSLHNLREVTETGREVVAKADRSLDRVDRTMNELGQAVASLRPQHTDGLLDLYALREGGLQADLDLDLYYGPQGKDFWRLGVVDLGVAERLDLQRGLALGGPWRLRGGIIANKAGLGLDWQARGWRGELELYDPARSLVDVYLWRSLGHDWQLGLGLRDALDERLPCLGLRRSFRASGTTPPP
jgi:phospholipid/cholesterol/gamma-HCH transport system substrate-binding protein